MSEIMQTYLTPDCVLFQKLVPMPAIAEEASSILQAASLSCLAACTSLSCSNLISSPPKADLAVHACVLREPAHFAQGAASFWL